MTNCVLLAVLLSVMTMVTASVILNPEEQDVAETALQSMRTKRTSGYGGSSKFTKKELELINRVLRVLGDDDETTTAPPSSSDEDTTPASSSDEDTTPASSSDEDTTPASSSDGGEEDEGDSMEWPDNNPVFNGLLSTIMDEYGGDVTKEDFLLFMAEATCILSDMIGNERRRPGTRPPPVSGDAILNTEDREKGRWFRGVMANNPLRNAQSMETRFLEAFCEAVAHDMDTGMKTLVQALERFSALKDAEP